MPDVRREGDIQGRFRDEPLSAVGREQAAARRAGTQSGVIAADQLLGLGFSRRMIRHRVSCGRLRVVHPDVYAVGAHPLTQRGRWYAALLATRPYPALSHRSSVAARGLGPEGPAVHVAVPRASPRMLAGVVVHRCPVMEPTDLTRIGGLPVTALHRTMLDIAENERFDRFEKIFEEADHRELLDMAAIRGCIDRNPGHRGLKPLARLLSDYLPVDGAKEGIERAFQRLLHEEGFRRPHRNVIVEGFLVDCWWPEQRLVVELDSRDFHAHWAQQQRDRARDGTLLRARIACLRVTDHRIAHQRGELIADLASRVPRA